jgi:hypothetical protein
MNLICYFDKKAGGNPAFIHMFKSMFEGLQLRFPEHQFTHIQAEPGMDHLPPYISNFLIINPENNKVILMSLWDRGMDCLTDQTIWKKFPIVQYLGGLGMSISSEEIKKTYGIEHIPFQYPLGVPNAYEYIDKFKTDYIPNKKIKKAIFMGALYGIRETFKKLTKNHPLIEVYGNDDPYHGIEYFKKLVEYKIAISFNGNGELCMRDFEAMGLKIPVVRSELVTQFYNRLIPDVHYIKATEPHDESIRLNSDHNLLTEQFVNTIESVIDDDVLLTRIANNGSDYFEKYCGVDYMIELYFKLININKLK